METSSRESGPLSVRDKSFPPSSYGRALPEFLATGPARSAFATPLLTLDAGATAHNTALMADWAQEAGVLLAPHGKTTMAPVLWRQLLDPRPQGAGAWGLTLATAWQAQVARAHGVPRVLIANEVVDPVGLRWIAEELAAHPDAEILSWADGVDVVRAMETGLDGQAVPRRLRVLVELGGAGGRTGARDRAAARAVAEALAASPVLELAGVGGYEGALAHDDSAASIARVDAYLGELARLHRELDDAGLYGAGEEGDRAGGEGGGVRAGGAAPTVRPIVTAGGSAYFDRVGAVLPPLCPDADVVVRSGAFQIHDDGFYAGISPMGRTIGDVPFRSAMHVWARVLSRPEPGLALLDCGKRDASFDEGLPVAQRVVGAEGDEAVLAGSRVSALNDQHLFLRLGDEAVASGAASRLRVGDVVRLGLSHPCTVLDKWRLIPVVADADAADPVVIDAVETIF